MKYSVKMKKLQVKYEVQHKIFAFVKNKNLHEVQRKGEHNTVV